MDARWLVPHFEKMLYDNALLARSYLQAYLLTGEKDLEEVATQTLDYLASDMRPASGGFSCARDADSEGEEGLYYVWTPEQIENVLEPEDARLFQRLYDVSPAGNFEGRSILHLPHPIEAIADAEGVAVAELKTRMASARALLLAERAMRPAPFRDDKVLVSWNAMAIRSFAEAGAALGRWDYVALASDVAEFIWSTMRRDGRLLHTAIGGRATIGAFLDDHAGLGNAALSLHAATLDARWLEVVRWLCQEILTRFWDDEAGTVYDTPVDGEPLVLRPRDAMDNATPSGSSLAAELLSRAGHLFDDDGYRDRARRIFEYESGAMSRYGPAYGRMLSVVDRDLADPIEVAIIGVDDDAPTRELVQAAHRRLFRNATVAGRLTGEPVAEVPLLAGRDLVDGKPAAYVCSGYACRLPVTSAQAVEVELGDATVE